MSTTELPQETVFDASAALRLDGGSTGTLMSLEEFLAIDDADRGYRYELIHGVVVVSPAPSEGERDLNGELEYWLRRYRDSHPSGRSLDATMAEQEIETSSGVRRADRAIWAGLGRRPDPRRDVPTIVIEFVSRPARDRRRDYEQKRDEYAALGVKEYWVIDRFRRTMTVCVEGKVSRIVHEHETYTSPTLSGFELPLALLLAVADRWPSA